MQQQEEEYCTLSVQCTVHILHVCTCSGVVLYLRSVMSIMIVTAHLVVVHTVL